MHRRGGIRVCCVVLAILGVTILGLIGCGVQKQGKDKVRDLDFTVVGEADLPEELRTTIKEKQAAPFKLTYSNDTGLYIVVGYGEQPTGGYSIAVRELYLTDNAIVIDTELQGPENGEKVGSCKSYPYVVVQTEYLENPVIFQ